jgi:hypothetical protein
MSSLVLKNADSLMLLVGVFITLLVIPNLFFLVESPKYLFDKGNILGLVKSLNKIAFKNGVILHANYFYDKLGIRDSDMKDQSIKNLKLVNSE